MSAPSVSIHGIHAKPSLKSATALLASADLPTSDLTHTHLEHFFYCGDEHALAGLVGIEVYGKHAFLRSLAVAPGARSTGIGSKLVAHAEAYARQLGVEALYLLTTTAQPFFERLGYRCTDRSNAPSAIQTTREFASICPASSAFMFKPLRTEARSP